jgi:hypothetical protein
MTATGRRDDAARSAASRLTEAAAEMRRKQMGQHTREVRETLSPEAKAVLMAQQAQIDDLKAALKAMMQAISKADAERKKGAA